MSRPQVGELRALRQAASDTPVIHTVTRAARTVLGSDVDADEHFIDVGGDSLSALTFSHLLADIFAVEVLVNHALPYPQVFGPNVVGTAELIRLALTRRIKPLIYLFDGGGGDER